MASFFLSKSQFLKGLQCPKSLYLQKYYPELAGEVSESREALFESGKEVGVLARGLHLGGVEILFDAKNFARQLELTKESIKKAHLVHINNQYERQGNIEIDKLFTMNDVTKDVKDLQKKIVEQVNSQRKMLSGKTPKIDIGEYCSEPYECEFIGHCWDHMPEESVFDLKGRGSKRFEFYRQGIIHMKDVPIKALPLPVQLQVDCALNKKCLINKGAIKEFLDSLWYPLYFLDFETFMSAIPLYDGTKPYQKIPFQYSIHYLEKEGSKLKHYEYLAEPNIDPRKEIAKRLVEQLPQ